jgi:argininosuccinate lyase
MSANLQWGGRFQTAPDPALIAFGSSLEEDRPLATFDIQCSRAHVLALRGGKIIAQAQSDEILAALDQVGAEIESGEFFAFARACGAEDVHGAIDARVRELTPAGASLHAGRSRNDQVATTLLLYAADRAQAARQVSGRIIARLLDYAEAELKAETLLAGTTHWQPAQPVLLAFYLGAVAEAFSRGMHRFGDVAESVKEFCPLGSGALSGSTLPLDRKVACAQLGFRQPSRNAMDAIGSRDGALDVAHAFVRAVATASRMSEELVIWCTPAFGYARLGDEASTGSSLMPQKRNPDPFELIRATGADLAGRYAGAVAATAAIGFSYHRDLQVTKAIVIGIIERGLVALDAFERALAHVGFNRERMNALAGENYTIATDVADALIAGGVAAREAHAAVGDAVLQAEEEGRALDSTDVQRMAEKFELPGLEAPLDARASVFAKKTSGSTYPEEVERALGTLRRDLEAAS